MSANTKTPEGFQVKSIEVSAAVYEDVAKEYDLDHSEAALAMLRQKKVIPDLPNVTEAAVRDAHEVIAEDKCLPIDHRLRAQMHLIASNYEQDMAREMLDSFCASFHRKVERKEKDAAYHARKLQEMKGDDRETEIGSAQYGEQEDKVNKLRDDIERWIEALDCAKRVYEQVTGDRWTPRLEAAPLADAGAAILWEQQMRTMKLMQGYRVVLMGDKPNDQYLPKVIEQLKQKAADMKKDLILITGDAASGFEPAVDSIGTKMGVTVFRVPLPDRKSQGVAKFFKRNSQMFNELKPNAAIVFGGGGVQGNIIELARQDKINVHAVVCPKGWTKDAGGLHKISA